MLRGEVTSVSAELQSSAAISLRSKCRIHFHDGDHQLVSRYDVRQHDIAPFRRALERGKRPVVAAGTVAIEEVAILAQQNVDCRTCVRTAREVDDSADPGHSCGPLRFEVRKHLGRVFLQRLVNFGVARRAQQHEIRGVVDGRAARGYATTGPSWRMRDDVGALGDRN